MAATDQPPVDRPVHPLPCQPQSTDTHATHRTWWCNTAAAATPPLGAPPAPPPPVPRAGRTTRAAAGRRRPSCCWPRHLLPRRPLAPPPRRPPPAVVALPGDRGLLLLLRRRQPGCPRWPRPWLAGWLVPCPSDRSMHTHTEPVILFTRRGLRWTAAASYPISIPSLSDAARRWWPLVAWLESAAPCAAQERAPPVPVSQRDRQEGEQSRGWWDASPVRAHPIAIQSLVAVLVVEAPRHSQEGVRCRRSRFANERQHDFLDTA